MAFSNAGLRNITSALMVVVVVFGAYFFLYFQHREHELSDYNLQLLQSSAGYTSDAMVGLFTNVQNAVMVGKWDRKASPDTNLSYVIERKRRLIDGLDSVGVSAEIASLLRDAGPNAYTFKNKDGETARVVVALDTRDADPSLVFAFSRHGLGADSIRAWQIDLQDLLTPTFPKEDFTGVALLRSGGEALFTEGSPTIQVQRLEVPRPSESEKGAGKSAIVSGSAAVDATIAGQKYKLFTQPLRVPILVNSRSGQGWVLEDNWALAGFLPAGRFRAMATEISPSVALIAIGLLVIGLLSMPLLRLRFMGAREELRYRHLVALSSAIVVGAALFTVGVLFYAMHDQSVHQSLGDLDSLSQQIPRHLDRELAELDSSLLALTELHITEGKAPGPAEWRYRRRLRPSILDSLPVAIYPRLTPFMETAFWIDAEGMQTSKWTILQNPTALVSVKKRSYFSDALSGRTSKEPAPMGAHDQAIFVDGRAFESIRSITTGRETGVVSRRYATDSTDAGNAVAAIESPLQSVIDPVLPPGLGFAILDENGLVQFHSDRVRNVREDFYGELGSDDAIRTAVALRQSTYAKTSYRTVPCLFRVRPIPNTPWFIVVFNDVRPARRWMIEVLAMTLIFLSLYVAVVLVVGLTIFRVWRDEDAGATRAGEAKPQWFWPSPDRSSEYVSLILWLSGMVVLGIVGVILSGLAALLPTVLLPLTAVALVRRVQVGSGVGRLQRFLPGGPFRRWSNDAAGGASTHSRMQRPLTLYRILITLMTVLMGVLPAAGIFRLVHDEVQVSVLERDESAFLDGMNWRSLERLNYYSKVRFDSTFDERLTNGVRGASSKDGPAGIYTPPQWAWHFGMPYGCPGRPTTPLTCLIRSSLGQMGILPAEIGAKQTSAYRWGECSGTLALTSVEAVSMGRLGGKPGRVLADSGPLVLSAPLRQINILGDLRFWVLALLGLYVSTRIARLIMKYAFFDGLVLPCPGPEELQVSGPWEGGASRQILLRCWLPKTVRDQLFVIDEHALRHAKGASSLLANYKSDPSLRGILLTRFDRGLKEPVLVRRKLDLLEAIDAMNPPVVFIESAVEPLYFLNNRLQDHYSERADLGISIDRWSCALQKYIRVRHDPRAQNSAVLEELPVSDEIGAALKEECSMSAVLVEIARQVAREGTANLDREEVIERVRDLAQAHYRRIWASCSSEEKLLLYRIATGGLVHRGALEVLQPLLRRGLAAMDPSVRIMNESFRRFILTAERAEVFAKWEALGEVSAWSRVKTPILVAFAALAVFFFATQREALNQTLGLLAALTAVVPGLLSALANLTRRK